MTDLLALLRSKMPSAAWIIDIQASRVCCSNAAAKALLSDSLHDIESGQRVIEDELKVRLSHYLETL